MGCMLCGTRLMFIKMNLMQDVFSYSLFRDVLEFSATSSCDDAFCQLRLFVMARFVTTRHLRIQQDILASTRRLSDVLVSNKMS